MKARASCWALLGDLDPVNGSSLDKGMALSIVRDLIRLQYPHLEKPGALTRLVEDATDGAYAQKSFHVMAWLPLLNCIAVTR